LRYRRIRVFLIGHIIATEYRVAFYRFQPDQSLGQFGPRPEVQRYIDLEDPVWRLVLEARPGIADPMTLRLRNEEALLVEVEGDRERFYLETLVPFKLEGYLDYLQARSWRSDLKVLWQTIVAVAFPYKAPLPTLEEIQSYTIRHRR